MASQPSAEEQLAFLAKIQRLFSEGDFAATYKFALVIALSDLAVERGRKHGGEQPRFSYAEIAHKFIELYWNHVLPYVRPKTDTSPMVLIQNFGKQAVVVSTICQFRKANQVNSLSLAPRHKSYQELLRKVAETVAAQPAKYLQNLAGSYDPFLFDRVRGGLQLKPGVAYCLRQFQSLIQQLARHRWIQHIKLNRLNAPVLGGDDDLESFLFAALSTAIQI